MSAPSRDEAFPQAVTEAVAAAFGGDVPALVSQMVDPAACAALISSGGAKLGFVFRVGAEELPRVRVALQNEVERLRSLLVARWPAAADFLSKHAAGHILAETDGGDELRLFVTGVDLGKDGAGRTRVGATLKLPGGAAGELTMFDAPPLTELTPAQAAFAQKVVAAGISGRWIVQRIGGAVASISLFTEQPTPADQLATLRGWSTGPRFKATLDRLERQGRVVDPYMLELSTEGVTDLTLWGIQALAQRADDLPAFFEPGQLPNATAFAAHVAMAVPDGDRAAAAEVVAGRIHPALAATVPAEVGPYAWFGDAWRWLIGRLAKEVPFQRLDVLRTIGAMAAIKAMEVPAYHLALGRYAASHPDKKLEVPAGVAGRSVESLQAEARGLLQSLEALAAEVAGVTGLGTRQIPALVTEVDTVKDTLQRAISGDFTAAVGLLHDLFLGMGPGGYDDDPALAHLDDIDLEADAAEAAIEEALAGGDDDDF
jgi:hypothetical protein